MRHKSANHYANEKNLTTKLRCDNYHKFELVEPYDQNETLTFEMVKAHYYNSEDQWTYKYFAIMFMLSGIGTMIGNSNIHNKSLNIHNKSLILWSVIVINHCQ